MAGTASTFNPVQACSAKMISYPPHALSSIDSKLFGLQFRCPSVSLASLSTSFRDFTITARFGGPRFDSRRTKKVESDDDEALDISSVRSDTVRLIDQKQNMLGIVSKREAIQIAEDAGLDLVIVSPEADPPVLKVMDYSKFRYEQQKKKKDQQKKTTRMDLKELKMGYNIDQHDYTVRLKAAQRFLKDGDRVKVIVNMRGRENEFRNNAIELIRRFQNDVGELGTEESKNFRERNMSIVLVPNKAVLQKAPEPPKKKNKPPVNDVNEVSAGV